MEKRPSDLQSVQRHTALGTQIRVMKERPILFTEKNVRAILEGCKTQTRRVLVQNRLHKVPPPPTGRNYYIVSSPIYRNGNPNAGILRKSGSWAFSKRPSGCYGVHFTCPYGLIRDQLWVREAWKVASNYDDYAPSEIPGVVINDGIVRYLADGESDLNGKTRASIHMPRWASRIDLEILKIRVERLQEITTEDCGAEGTQYLVNPSEKHPGRCTPVMRISGDFLPLDYMVKPYQYTHENLIRAHFASLWDSINFARGYGWEKNPWVWVIEFRPGEPLRAVCRNC